MGLFNTCIKNKKDIDVVAAIVAFATAGTAALCIDYYKDDDNNVALQATSLTFFAVATVLFIYQTCAVKIREAANQSNIRMSSFNGRDEADADEDDVEQSAEDSFVLNAP